MSGRWLEAERGAVVVDHVLDTAARLFAARGVAAVSMAEVARAAGCSRATLYRYFANRRALQQAFVNREARRIAEQVATRVAGIDDSDERVVVAVASVLEAVRADERLRTWFTTGGAGTAADLASSSEAIGTLASTFLGDPADPDTRIRAGWLVRIIVSLLTTPSSDASEERMLLERFVAPVMQPSPRVHARLTG